MRILPPSFFTLALCFGLCGFSPSAQTVPDDPVPEQLYVHLDKPFYVTGETIWYKVYFLHQDKSAIQSNILYLDLISPTGEVVVHQKLQRNHFHAHGDITIPLNWEEGFYTLRCYTRWNLNFGSEAIFLQYIPVYNVWNEMKASSNEPSATVQTPDQLNKQDLKISLQTNQPVYGKNDSVKLTITVTDAANQPVNANLSLAVLDTDLISFEENAEISEEHTPLLPIVAPDQLKFAPEKELDLQVNIVSPDASEPVSSRFISVYSVENQEFINTLVTQGELSVFFPDFFGPKTIQIHNHNPFQEAAPLVTVHNILDILPPPDLPAQILPRNPEIERYLHLNRLRHKLHEIFIISSINYSSNTEIMTSPFVPDKIYQIENFQLIKNVEEFIDHVFTKVRISSKNGGKSVRLFDPISQKFLEDNPWYIVNGYLTNQEEKVLAMPLNNIKKLELFLQRHTIIHQFPSMMLRSGVIAIYTKDKITPTELITERNTFVWEGFYCPQPFTTPSFPVSHVDKMPDFRPLVYWEPSIETNHQGKATITFPASKAISQFMIQVEGVSVGGEFGKAQSTYQTQFSN